MLVGHDFVCFINSLIVGVIVLSLSFVLITIFVPFIHFNIRIRFSFIIPQKHLLKLTNNASNNNNFHFDNKIWQLIFSNVI